MKLQNIGLGLLLTVATATGAVAGTTSNLIEHGYETGHRDVEVKNVRVETGNFINESFNIKIDAVGENAGTHIKFDGEKFTGGGFANNIENPDPFVNGGTVYTLEEGTFTDTTKAYITEEVDFGSTYVLYELETGY